MAQVLPVGVFRTGVGAHVVSPDALQREAGHNHASTWEHQIASSGTGSLNLLKPSKMGPEMTVRAGLGPVRDDSSRVSP